MPPEPPNLTVLLNRGSAGDRAAADQAFRFVYDRLRAIAAGTRSRRGTGQTPHPTTLVHEAYAKLFRGSDPAWEDRGHFYAVAAKAMRHIAIDRARAALSAKRGGGWSRVSSDAISSGATVDPADLIALDEALKQLATLHERQARVVELRFFAGLSVREVATLLGCSDRTVELDWRTARAWLRNRIGESAA